MNIFNIDENVMNQTSSFHTLNEIYQQPKTWLKTLTQINKIRESLQNFIDSVIKCDDYDVILTGAGTSEFVGNALFAALNKKLNYKIKSYGTTDLVATPEAYLSKTKPTLLISFGRSGNSPESIGAVNVASTVCENLYNLFITCNKDGALSKMAETVDNCYAINLTDETHDKSFAMTSSFSNMYLAAYLTFNLDLLDEINPMIEKLVSSTQTFLDKNFVSVEHIIKSYDFERIVYLGSDSLKGISQESALKMLELTAGQIVAIFDTPLGFRHGPKSIIDDSTLLVIYVSNNPYTYQYELDLIKELSAQRKGNKLAVVSDNYYPEMHSLSDFYISFDSGTNASNGLLGLQYITFAQSVSVLKSLSINITPDNPCPSGEVNRVVKGVNLYPYKSI